MSACRTFLLIAAVLVPTACSASAPVRQGPGLGRAMTGAELAFWDTFVLTDGTNLPPGSGSSNDGARIYVQKCAACHGPTGAETNTGLTPLIGGVGTLASDRPLKTLGSYWPYSTIVFDYIRRAMPYDSPKSLSNDEVYALTAYLLSRNGIIEGAATLDRSSLPAVRMPNRDGFVTAPLNLPSPGGK